VEHNKNRAPGSAAFIFVFITVALDMVAVGIVVPVLPKLIIEFEHGNVASAARYIGLFAMLWAAMQFIFSPIIGATSDRFGRRAVILLSNFGLGLDYLLMALSPSVTWLLAGRVISGITSASYPTAGAYIADVTPPAERAAKFGMLGAAFGLGFIVGPAVGGLLGGINLRLPFWVAGGLSLANAAYGYFILPESLPKEKRRPFSLRNAHIFGSLKLLRSHPELLGLAGVMFIMALSHEALPNVFVLYTDQRYGWSQTGVGLALAVVGLSSAIVSMMVVRPLVKRVGERNAALLGLTFGITGYCVFALAHTGLIFLCGIALIAMWGVAGPSFQSLMSHRVDPTEQGQLQGAIGSMRAMTGMLGPILFTQVFAAAVRHGGTAVLGAPYLLAAALLLVTLLCALRVLPRRAAAHR
jgi:DHA1 family tetracycline resistance protein-like MFS transporter